MGAKKHLISGRIWFLLSQQMLLLKAYALWCSCSVWEGLWINFLIFLHSYSVLDTANLQIRTASFNIYFNTFSRLLHFEHFAVKNWGSLPKPRDMFLRTPHEGNYMFTHEMIDLFSELLLFTTCSRSFPAFYMSFHLSESSYIYERGFCSWVEDLIHVFDFSHSLLCVDYSSQRQKCWDRTL